MNTEIVADGSIPSNELDGGDYFMSLLSAGFSRGKVTDKQLVTKQYEILALLKERIHRYTSGDSDSVRTEIGENIAKSNLYCAGIYLKTLPTPDIALNAVLSKTFDEIYRLGRKKLKSKVLTTENIFELCRKTAVSTDNITYNSVLSDKMKVVFRRYNQDFNATDNMITADYPVYLQSRENLLGMEFILDYFSRILNENRILEIFSPNLIKAAECALDPNPEELVYNIYERVLISCTASYSIGNSPFEPCCDTQNTDKAIAELSGHDIRAIAGDALSIIAKSISSTGAKRYLFESADKISSVLLAYDREQRLGDIILPRK